MSDSDTKKTESGISIRLVGGITTLIAVVLAFFAFTMAGRVGDVQEQLADDERQYVECSDAVNKLRMASDFLTSQARSFVVTGRRAYMDSYVEEIEVTNRRGKAVEVLRQSFTADDRAAQALEQALSTSDKLAQTELAAMKLAAEHYGLQDVPDLVNNVNSSVYKRGGDDAASMDVATNLVLDANYDEAKQEIESEVEASSGALLSTLNDELEENEQQVQRLLFQLRVSVALLLCDIMILVLALFMYVLKPLGGYVKRINENEPLENNGAHELHYLANAYNAMYEDNAKHIEQLRALSERDPLTGISNRGGYDNFLATHTRDVALLLIDIDNFRDYNAVYGHDTGDAALQQLASALTDAFRSTDFPCRIENDEFAVIMTNMSSDLRSVIENKIEQVNTILSDGSDELPLVTMSVGAAFSTEGMSDQEIYRAASIALEHAKQAESHDVVFYGEHNAV